MILWLELHILYVVLWYYVCMPDTEIRTPTIDTSITGSVVENTEPTMEDSGPTTPLNPDIHMYGPDAAKRHADIIDQFEDGEKAEIIQDPEAAVEQNRTAAAYSPHPESLAQAEGQKIQAPLIPEKPLKRVSPGRHAFEELVFGTGSNILYALAHLPRLFKNPNNVYNNFKASELPEIMKNEPIVKDGPDELADNLIPFPTPVSQPASENFNQQPGDNGKEELTHAA
jgi:hypothetical protein